MKKTFLIFSCAISLCFFGCASKDVPATIEDEISAPEIEETSEEENSDVSEENAGEESADEETDISEEESTSSNDDEVSDISEDFPLLDEIDEPEVITLDPPVISEIEETTEDAELEEALEPEEVELPSEEPKQNFDENTDNISSDKPDTTETSDESDDSLNPENSDDVIDITDDDASATESDEERYVEEITPSRKVTLKKSEYLDIVYPGNGWVFMGLVDGSKDLTYFGRKLGTGQTKFTLQAKNAGTKIVHFYKEDNLTTQTLDDYIEVEILNEKGSNTTHVSAPEYKLPLTKKATEIIKENQKKAELKAQQEAEKDEETETEKVKAGTTERQSVVITPDEPAKAPVTSPAKAPKTEQKSPVITPEVETKTETLIPEVKKDVPVADQKLLLKEAQVLYNEKEYKAANEKLDQFFEVAVNKRDEGLYLRGQILEAKSNIQNIKEAIEAYTTLTKNYPASKYWEDANKRIIYLKRFYLEVR